MEIHINHKKFWKPPSFEDFNVLFPNKKIKLDSDDVEEKLPEISKEIAEPRTASELAIHPKKIEELRSWLKRNLNSKASILLITGPPGCGKTTTLKILASEEGIQIKEWINPINKTEYKPETVLQSDAFDKFNFFETGQNDKFEDFIFRSSRYQSLYQDQQTALILVKDIPNVFIWKPKSFHEFLDKYKNHGKSPIVFIITDDQNLNLCNSLFPNHVRNQQNVTNIKFNPVNNSSLIKNLKTFCDFYCPEKVSSQILEEICKNSGGDLRSAINDLVWYVRASNVDLTQKPKRSKSGFCASTKLLSLKQNNFGFYQVLGRVLYPKLLTEKEKADCLNPNQIFMHDVQKIISNLSSSHLGILHENYLCTFTKLEDVVGAAECFSFCDVLDQHQELAEFTSTVGILGLMLKNTCPRKRGFKPIKKSFRFCETNQGCNMNLCQAFNCRLSERDFLLDFMPYMKFVKTGKSVEDVSDCCDEPDEKIEIEEFDD